MSSQTISLIFGKYLCKFQRFLWHVNNMHLQIGILILIAVSKQKKTTMVLPSYSKTKKVFSKHQGPSASSLCKLMKLNTFGYKANGITLELQQTEAVTPLKQWRTTCDLTGKLRTRAQQRSSQRWKMPARKAKVKGFLPTQTMQDFAPIPSLPLLDIPPNNTQKCLVQTIMFILIAGSDLFKIPPSPPKKK